MEVNHYLPSPLTPLPSPGETNEKKNSNAIALKVALSKQGWGGKIS
jgi:hypothetical protein